MERINELLDEVIKICEVEGIPFMSVYGKDVIHVNDFQPADTPERLKKTFNTLMAGTKQTKRVIEIQG